MYSASISGYAMIAQGLETGVGWSLRVKDEGVGLSLLYAFCSLSQAFFDLAYLASQIITKLHTVLVDAWQVSPLGLFKILTALNMADRGWGVLDVASPSPT